MSKSFLTVLFLSLASAFAGAAAAEPDKEAFLSLAQKGWVYELRSSVLRRDASMPPVRLDSKKIAQGSVCLIGEKPHNETRATLATFDRLLRNIFNRSEGFLSSGADASACGPAQTYIRLYSGRPPFIAYNRDLRWIDETFDIGLPKDRDHRIFSPAQAITYFGRKGTAVYLLVKQPRGPEPSELERRFYRSILTEELFQAFSFGVDILVFEPTGPFLSKIQETPVNLRHMNWNDPRYMEGMLSSNPGGLCEFDLFMLHALARTRLTSSNSPAFLQYISDRFTDLEEMAHRTLADGIADEIVDPECGHMPGFAGLDTRK
ncbi:hypothetical protein [Algicella marina]|uniref:Uncharacterized protein n=1 Tax=Algicella marina TaxID=2683284 RepID=A0A6P1T4V6_9RHOB|nr:hypothetical protein [Algicella marina]QHQ36516.1 hypothetical protein GO499_15720 [Algicella marina]